MVGLIIKLTQERLTGENNQIYSVCTYGDSTRIGDPRTNGAVYTHISFWEFKGKAGNSQVDEEEQIWQTNSCRTSRNKGTQRVVKQAGFTRFLSATLLYYAKVIGPFL